MLFFTKKKSLTESGTLAGYTDRHSHLLPGVDDGFKTADDSLAALEAMEEAGIADVWFTPHIMEDIPNTTSELKERFADFKASYKGKINLHLAAENMLDNLFAERFAADDLLTMEDNILLVETSYFNPPIGLEATLDAIMRKGYRPLLAHPERYKYMDTSDYERLHSRGILFQLNLGALAGGYSPETQKKAKELLKRGWYHFSGTDIHSIRQIQAILSTPIPTSQLTAIKQLPNHI